MKTMIVGLLGISTLLCQSVMAETVYRCTQSNGVTQFSDNPCAAKSEVIEIKPAPTVKLDQFYRENPSFLGATEDKYAPARLDQGRQQTRYNSDISHREMGRIRQGMSEVEVVSLLGEPDREIIEADEGVIRKSFYYIKQGHNAQVVRITFLGGNVLETDRSKLQRYN